MSTKKKETTYSFSEGVSAFSFDPTGTRYVAATGYTFERGSSYLMKPKVFVDLSGVE